MSDAVPDVARAEIVGAVRRALAKHGYARLTTKKVAAESEKSEAFFFYHYDTKDDLVVAFLDWATERSAERLAAIDSDDPVTRLFVACDVLVGDYENEDDRGINVAMMELLSHAPHDEAFHDRLSAYKRSVIDELAAIVSLGIESGAFRDVDPEATAAYLLMTADGTTGAVMALGMTDVGEKVRERLFDYLTSTVLADGVSPPAAFA